jgi:hypothetical protein
MDLLTISTTLVGLAEDARQYIKDSGPLYHEFHAEHFIKEPWNAFSSLFFLVPVAFWIWKLRGQYRKYIMITLILPLLFINGVGSTLYHAFRASQLALMMDWMPAFFMNLILAWYMWKKVIRNGWASAAMVLIFYVLAIGSMATLQRYIGVGAANVGYLFIGLSLLLPSTIFLMKTNYYKWYLLLGTFIFLGIALVFRSLDYPTPNPFPNILPQGTHFLWHITSAFAVFTLGYYLMFIRDIDLRRREDVSAVRVESKS